MSERGTKPPWLHEYIPVPVEVLEQAIALDGPLWLIWSNEHGGAWWAPDRCGYTREVLAAGRYTLEEALRCCELRSKRPDGVPCEVVVPAPELVMKLSALRAALQGEGGK